VFYLAAVGLCLYTYGHLSAKLGYGNWKISLITFLVGFPLLIYGIFKILDAIAQTQ